MTDISLRDIQLLLPEVILALWASLVLTVDLFIDTRRHRQPLLALALVGIVGAAIASVALLGQNTTAFFGLVVVDDFSIFFKLIFLLAAGLVLLSSESFTERIRENTAELYGLILFCTMGLMLMATTKELMSIYLALELSSLSLAFLATWAKRELRSSEAGLKYFVLSAVSSSILLFGMALMYGITGSTDLSVIGLQLTADASPAALLAMSLILAGFGFKIAAVPFQMWTPDVYEGAPTPVTAFLSVASKSAGFAVVMRIFDVALGQGEIQVVWTQMFVVISILTMFVGNLAALLQTNIKRMLAYSSIAHVGYMLMGLAAANPGGAPNGLSAVMFYLLVYAFTNLGAFAVVIAVSRYVEGEDISSYAGLGQRAPILALIFSICLLSLAGIPPLAGFFAKMYLFWAAAERGLYLPVILGVINSAISLYYYARVIRQMYMLEPATAAGPVRVGRVPAVSLAAAAIGVVFMGFLASPFIQAAFGAATTIVR